MVSSQPQPIPAQKVTRFWKRGTHSHVLTISAGLLTCDHSRVPPSRSYSSGLKVPTPTYSCEDSHGIAPCSLCADGLIMRDFP